MGYSSSQTAPVQILSTGCCPSGTECSSMGPPWAAVPTRKLAPAWAPLHKPCFLPVDCSIMGSPVVAASLRTCPPALAWGPPQAAGRYLLHHGLPWAAGRQPAYHGLVHGLQGNFCSGAWGTSSLSFLTNLVVCKGFSPILLIPVSQLLCSVLYPFFNMLSRGLISSADGLSRVRRWASCVQHGGSCWAFLTEATPTASPLPTSCRVHPIQPF